jgi:hypothetical protein
MEVAHELHAPAVGRPFDDQEAEVGLPRTGERQSLDPVASHPLDQPATDIRLDPDDPSVARLAERDRQPPARCRASEARP